MTWNNSQQYVPRHCYVFNLVTFKSSPWSPWVVVWKWALAARDKIVVPLAFDTYRFITIKLCLAMVTHSCSHSPRSSRAVRICNDIYIYTYSTSQHYYALSNYVAHWRTTERNVARLTHSKTVVSEQCVSDRHRWLRCWLFPETGKEGSSPKMKLVILNSCL